MTLVRLWNVSDAFAKENTRLDNNFKIPYLIVFFWNKKEIEFFCYKMINIVVYVSTGERKPDGTIKCLVALVGLYIVKDPNRTSDGVVETTDEFFLAFLPLRVPLW